MFAEFVLDCQRSKGQTMFAFFHFLIRQTLSDELMVHKHCDTCLLQRAQIYKDRMLGQLGYDTILAFGVRIFTLEHVADARTEFEVACEQKAVIDDFVTERQKDCFQHDG